MSRLFYIAGHGAGDSGAVGNGYREADLVRKLGRKLKELGGDMVVLSDFNVNYYASKTISTMSLPSDCVILEGHMDSGGAGAHGGHVIIKSGLAPDGYDKALARLMETIFPGRANSIVGRSELANPNRAAARGFNYRLVEFGFISDAGDVKKFNERLDEIASGVLKAFNIKPKTEPTPAKPKQVPGDAINNNGLKYHAHIQSIGDAPVVHDGQVAGTVGYGKRLEGLYVDISEIKTKYPDAKLNAKAHVQGIGWKRYKDVSSKDVIGTIGQSKRLEALELELVGIIDKKLKFRTHVQGVGWTPWVTSGFASGSVGMSKRIEAIQIVVE